MKEDNEEEVEEEIIPEFEHNEKVKLEDVINELPDIIHKEFDYFNYSEQDKSNDRFMRKQENTNQMRDQLFSYLLPQEENNVDSKKKNDSLTIQFE